MKQIAIVLSAGRGTRMKQERAKQYLLIKGRPVICYALETFENCPFIDEIVLVTGEQEQDYCRKEIVEKYGFSKVRKITSGGKERFHSVYQGLLAAGACDLVYIHDGARPFVTREILERARQGAQECGACVVGMPVKDTIKIADGQNYAVMTPNRSLVWQVQTPQVFSYELILNAYQKLMQRLEAGEKILVTDDAMVAESMTDTRVKLVKGSYTNLKITTPEDLEIAEVTAERRYF